MTSIPNDYSADTNDLSAAIEESFAALDQELKQLESANNESGASFPTVQLENDSDVDYDQMAHLVDHLRQELAEANYSPSSRKSSHWEDVYDSASPARTPIHLTQTRSLDPPGSNKSKSWEGILRVRSASQTSTPARLIRIDPEQSGSSLDPPATNGSKQTPRSPPGIRRSAESNSFPPGPVVTPDHPEMSDGELKEPPVVEKQALGWFQSWLTPERTNKETDKMIPDIPTDKKGDITPVSSMESNAEDDGLEESRGLEESPVRENPGWGFWNRWLSPERTKEVMDTTPPQPPPGMEDYAPVSTMKEADTTQISSGESNGEDDADDDKYCEVASEKKMGKPVEEHAASRPKATIIIIFSTCLLATLLAVTLPFLVDTNASASAVIETSSPSVSMLPSSTPSVSQVPSASPSSAPSIYPTISNVPTIAPSGHPTVSASPSLAPSISDAPTPAPSIVPTESIEPSGYPSQVPSASPSANPTTSAYPTLSHVPSGSLYPSVSPSATPSDYPTRTFRPSSQPSPDPTPRPTRRPTPRPTRNPTPRPTPRPTRRPTPRPTPMPPPPGSFKIRLHWSPDYFWQETKAEAWWCMECVKCAEYGGLDAGDHGCVSHGSGDESRCRAGDSIWVRDCRSRGNRFHVQSSADNRFMLRVANTNLCIERIRYDHPHLFLQGCDVNNPYQRFNPWNNYNRFELRPPGLNDCVSQAHHPKAGELLSLHNCGLANRDETLYWERYG